MEMNIRRRSISVLDDELLMEIFCRLGASKYAIQCKSVCKFWCSVIDTSSSDSYFLCRWRQINTTEEGIVFVTQSLCNEMEHAIDCSIKELPSLDLNFIPRPICIQSACKDLLLCSPGRFDHSCYYLCNPFTKQWTTLPLPPPPPAEELWITRYTKVGFIGDDGLKFTVVRIVPYRNKKDVFDDETKAHIFVLSSDDIGGGWRHVGGRQMFVAPWKICNKILSYKGMLVFFFGLSYGGNVPKLIAFKLDPRPDAGGNSTCFVLPFDHHQPDAAAIGVCSGLLRLAQLVEDPQKLIVWQLQDSEKQEWAMVQDLDIKEMVEGLEDCHVFRRYYGYISLLAFHPYDGDILYLSFSLDRKITYISFRVI